MSPYIPKERRAQGARVFADGQLTTPDQSRYGTASDEARAPRRRDERIAAAHAAATAPASWVCRVAGCPIVDVWQPAAAKVLAEKTADTHYRQNHYTPPEP